MMPALRVGKYVRPDWVRRHLVQIGALTVAVVTVAVLAVVAFRPSGGGTGVSGVRVTAPATATADPRVGEVKAVARAYLAADWDSAKTGDTSAVDALTEKDLKAFSDAATSARISKEAHHNFVALRIDTDERTWAVDVLSTQATVTVTYRLFGHDADWPSLRPREPDHETDAFRTEFRMELVGGNWLIYDSV